MFGGAGSRAGEGRGAMWAQAGGLIEKKIFTGVETGFEFKDIPQGYTSLELEVFGRLAVATGQLYLPLRFNNDSGANYDHQWLHILGSSVGAGQSIGQTSEQHINLVGTSFPAGQSSGFVMRIAGYSQGSMHKAWYCQSGKWANSTSTFNQYCLQGSGGWRGTAPITSIQCGTLGSSATFAAGSYATLRGLP